MSAPEEEEVEGSSLHPIARGPTIPVLTEWDIFRHRGLFWTSDLRRKPFARTGPLSPGSAPKTGAEFDVLGSEVVDYAFEIASGRAE
jgi:hypothetical protein